MPKILVLTANSKISPLQLSHEVELIRTALGEYSNFSIQLESEVQAKDFVSILRRTKPDIIHFAGHGGSEQIISLRSDNYDAPLTSQQFARILTALDYKPKLIVLNACFSDGFANDLLPHAAALVGSNTKIGDSAAQHFARSFYANLADSRPVSAAFELARVDLDLAGHDSGSITLKLSESWPDSSSIVFYGRPELMACFSTDRAGKPLKTGKRKDEFMMWIWLRGVDQNTDSVTYQVCHETFDEQFWEISRNSSSRFITEDFSSGGDVTIRAVAWTKERGVGTESTLVTALKRHYGEAPAQAFSRAIQTIDAN